jgi:hypothetical protein
MSKFIDKLGRIYRTAAPSLGFRQSAAETDLPPLALIADLTNAGAKKAKSIAGSKVDAAVISSENLDADSFEELTRSIDGLPLGLQLAETNDPDKIQEILKLNWDFLVFGLQTPFESINKEGSGKILRIEPSLTPALIRAINELSFSIDAVLITGNNFTVTIERLLTCQLFASLLNKPLLVNVNSAITNNELSNLHGTGVKGLILPEGAPLKVFTELKKTISSLPKKTPKRKTGTGVLLPRIGIPTEPDVEKIEEDEDDEDI